MAKQLIFFLIFLMALNLNSAEAKTITDVAGRKVEVAEEINRLIALGSSMAFVTYLNAQDLVVGVEAIDKRDDIAKPYILINRDKFKNLPVVGTGSAMRLHNYEEIVKLKPDLIFLVAAAPDEANLLQKKTNIPVVVLSAGSPAFDQELFLQSIKLSGDILNRQDRAKQLTDYLLSLPGELGFRPDEKNMAKAYVGGLSYKGDRDITSTTSDSLPMRLAGIQNIMDSTEKRGQFFINKEHLLVQNPSLIFIDSNGLALIREAVKKEPAFYSRLKAFKNKNVWLVLPHTSYMSNPEILYINSFVMAKLAYPDKYEKMLPAQKADEVFTMFFGCPLYSYYEENYGGIGCLDLKGSELEFIPY